ncbi:hypothetical protein INR49_028664, partial [Caranx melampygus]
LPSLVWLTLAIQQIPTEHPRLPYSEIPAPPVPVSAAAVLSPFCGATNLDCPCVRPCLRCRPVGCRWKPAYHDKWEALNCPLLHRLRNTSSTVTPPLLTASAITAERTLKVPSGRPIAQFFSRGLGEQ